jgi:acetoin utilization deacetylase AcuC-like enzyme
VYDPIYLEHDLRGHPECAARLESILAKLEGAGILEGLTLLEPRPATGEELQRIHTAEHVARVRRKAEGGGGHFGPDTYVSPRSFEAALTAAGGVVRAVEAVLGGQVDNGFALVRPPGHHATPTQAMGFCLFNNIAVAARAALALKEVERVLIADFDVHHGNGTQDVFENDPAVFYVSSHQYPYYPGSGHWSETGQGDGEGSVLDVPLSAGVGDEGYARVFSELVEPLGRRFRPDLVLVSAGYDAHWSDPLAQMNLSLSGYARMAQSLVTMAEELCDGRIVFVLEGGYQLEVLACGVLNALYTMMGEDVVVDPFGPSPRPERSADQVIVRLKELHGLD